jgi:hypothetical protein
MTRDEHPAVITPRYGVGPETEGLPIRPIRIIGYRAFCPECDWLWLERENYFAARWDADQHRKGKL